MMKANHKIKTHTTQKGADSQTLYSKLLSNHIFLKVLFREKYFPAHTKIKIPAILQNSSSISSTKILEMPSIHKSNF